MNPYIRTMYILMLADDPNIVWDLPITERCAAECWFNSNHHEGKAYTREAFVADLLDRITGKVKGEYSK